MRFSLRTFLLIMFATGIALGWLGWRYELRKIHVIKINGSSEDSMLSSRTLESIAATKAQFQQILHEASPEYMVDKYLECVVSPAADPSAWESSERSLWGQLRCFESVDFVPLLSERAAEIFKGKYSLKQKYILAQRLVEPDNRIGFDFLVDRYLLSTDLTDADELEQLEMFDKFSAELLTTRSDLLERMRSIPIEDINSVLAASILYSAGERDRFVRIIHQWFAMKQPVRWATRDIAFRILKHVPANATVDDIVDLYDKSRESLLFVRYRKWLFEPARKERAVAERWHGAIESHVLNSIEQRAKRGQNVLEMKKLLCSHIGERSADSVFQWLREAKPEIDDEFSSGSLERRAMVGLLSDMRLDDGFVFRSARQKEMLEHVAGLLSIDFDENDREEFHIHIQWLERLCESFRGQRDQQLRELILNEMGYVRTYNEGSRLLKCLESLGFESTPEMWNDLPAITEFPAAYWELERSWHSQGWTQAAALKVMREMFPDIPSTVEEVEAVRRVPHLRRPLDSNPHEFLYRALATSKDVLSINGSIKATDFANGFPGCEELQIRAASNGQSVLRLVCRNRWYEINTASNVPNALNTIAARENVQKRFYAFHGSINLSRLIIFTTDDVAERLESQFGLVPSNRAFYGLRRVHF